MPVGGHRHDAHHRPAADVGGRHLRGPHDAVGYGLDDGDGFDDGLDERFGGGFTNGALGSGFDDTCRDRALDDEVDDGLGDDLDDEFDDSVGDVFDDGFGDDGGRWARPSVGARPLLEAVRARRGAGWSTRLTDLLDRTGTTWPAVAGGALALGLVGGIVLWLLREPTVPIEAQLPVVVPASVTTTAPPPTEVVVHVAGAVARPGVQRLPAGARVIDAVGAAGGPTPEADLARINLAALVLDGSQIYLPAVGEVPPPGVSSGGGGPPGGDGGDVLDLNTATADQLDALPGIGPATAAAIVEHRDTNGPFTSVEELLEVRGIGEAKLAQIRERVRV